MTRVDPPPWPSRAAMGAILVRQVEGRDGRLLTVVDSFPETFTVTEAFLARAGAAMFSVDRERERCWVAVANGLAEYLMEYDPSGCEYRCARLYQEIDWPAPRPEENS